MKVALFTFVITTGPLSMTVSGAAGGGGVVALTVLLGDDVLPAPSTASTAYVCVLPASTVESV